MSSKLLAIIGVGAIALSSFLLRENELPDKKGAVSVRYDHSNLPE